MKTLTQNEVIQHTRAILGKSFNKKWESDLMHGECITQLVSEDGTFLWL
jgi:hypothetical protein